MYPTEKEQALIQLLETMYYIEEKLGESEIFYEKISRTINNIKYETCIFKELESLINDYKNVVLKEIT